MKNRFLQVSRYSLRDSKMLQIKTNQGCMFRWAIFSDMISLYLKYRIWTNQYLQYEIHLLPNKQKNDICKKLKLKNKIRDDWQKEFITNRKFLNKFSKKRYELPKLRHKRNEAYKKKYNMGIGCLVEFNVELSRQHYLNGTITIGDNVLLAKNVFIDYSGDLEIKNGVKIAAGVVIETHHRDLVAFEGGFDVNIPTKLVIEENVYIGVNAIILDSCDYIGKNARIGAGAVVTKNVPEHATVVGVPAKVIKINN